MTRQPHTRHTRFLAAGKSRGIIIAAIVIACTCSSWLRADSGQPRPDTEQRIERLIGQLGSNEFAVREKAKDELLTLGVEAFDALHRAQHHDDVEIRKQAEYLIRAIRIVWVHEDDPPQVKQILRNYRSEGLEERQSRLNRLARVGDDGGIEPLCRLVRFEASDNLSKRAAILVMNATLDERTVLVEPWDQVIDRVVGNSQRRGAVWLRLYARYLREPLATLDEWNKLAKVEQQEMKLRPDKTRLVILRDFLRWQVDALEKLGKRDRAIATMWQTLELQDATRSEILATVDWLIDRKAWFLIDVLAEQYSATFEDDPELIFRLAEAFRSQKAEAKAEEYVVQAMAIKKPDEPFLHVEVARELQRRGMIDWAEREYRHVIKTETEGSRPSLDSRIRLGWMMHDLARHNDAYEALRGVVELIEKDQAVARRLDEMQRHAGRIRSQMHFSRALALASKDNSSSAQIDQLKLALKNDNTNADILIAMYRVPDAPEDYQKETKQVIKVTANRFRSTAALAERNFQTVPNADTREQLALMLNQYAWLVANTEGDYQTALESSRRSLDLVPDEAGYLDTLARCYYAKGELDEAIRQQRRAVELEAAFRADSAAT